jgi:hypothetical protein
MFNNLNFTIMNEYRIDGINESFRSIEEVKNFIDLSFTEREKVKYLTGCNIGHHKNGLLISRVTIRFDHDGYICYGRLIKIQNK